MHKFSLQIVQQLHAEREELWTELHGRGSDCSMAVIVDVALRLRARHKELLDEHERSAKPSSPSVLCLSLPSSSFQLGIKARRTAAACWTCMVCSFGRIDTGCKKQIQTFSCDGHQPDRAQDDVRWVSDGHIKFAYCVSAI